MPGLIQPELNPKSGDKEDFQKLREPQFDIDYSKSIPREKDIRGNMHYYCPKGWVGKALKVIGKYEDEKWLTMNNGPREWAVGFHGTEEGYMNSILEKGFFYSNITMPMKMILILILMMKIRENVGWGYIFLV